MAEPILPPETRPAQAPPVASMYCTFFIAGQLYGIPVDQVQEVLLGQPLTRVPLSPVAVVGLINLRGQIVTAIDMRRVLALPPGVDADEQMNVVLRGDGIPVSLLVDGISDILTPPSPLEPPPETLRRQMSDFITGVFQLERALLLVLDIEKILGDASCMQVPGEIGLIEQQETAH